MIVQLPRLAVEKTNIERLVPDPKLQLKMSKPRIAEKVPTVKRNMLLTRSVL